MLRQLVLAAVAALFSTSALAQGPPPPPPPGNLPFADPTIQTYGRANANTTDSVGDPHSDQDEDLDGPANNIVHATSSDGPASSSSTGFMNVGTTPVALTCHSKAYGACSPVSTQNPAPAVDADYDVLARTEAGATNNYTDKDVTVVVRFTGTRSSMNENNVGGYMMVAVKSGRGPNPILRKIKILVANDGWQVKDGQLYATPTLSHTAELTLAPGEFIGLTCSAKASSDGQDDDDTESQLEMKCEVWVKQETQEPPGGGPPAP